LFARLGGYSRMVGTSQQSLRTYQHRCHTVNNSASSGKQQTAEE